MLRMDLIFFMNNELKAIDAMLWWTETKKHVRRALLDSACYPYVNRSVSNSQRFLGVRR